MKSLEKEKMCGTFFGLGLCVILMLRIYILGAQDQTPLTNSIEYQEKVPSRALLQGAKIDLNNANIHGLMALPGIGPKRAKKIILLRKKQHFFDSLEDLTRGKAISKRLLDQLRPYVVIRPSRQDDFDGNF